MLILLFFAFLAGVITVLSPCILPVLPIVLASSTTSGCRRPLGIVLGFVLSFTFFTLFLSSLVQLLHIPSDLLRLFSMVIIFIFGVSLLIPQFQLILERAFVFFSRFASLQKSGGKKKNWESGQREGFWPGFIVGLSLGLLWTPCVGPILASVIALTLTGSVNNTSLFITLAYAIGTSIPLFMILYGGQNALQKVPWLLRNTEKIQRAFGVVMMITAVALYLNLDRQFQTWILERFPQYGAGLTQIEENSDVQQQLQQLRTLPQQTQQVLENVQYPPAPDFTGGGTWINSPSLSLKNELKGKVVLVDFWTYSCINCIRTLPYLKKWYDTYKDQGFVIVGVHSPEFEFEKNTDNVKKAVADFGILYPVVQDNNFTIWTAYHNQAWPAHYLIDKNGRIREAKDGEGDYDKTENAIRQLLGEKVLPPSQLESKNLPPQPQGRPQTPETYMGYTRGDAYVLDNEIKNDTAAVYTHSSPIPDDAVALNGPWLVSSEYIEAQPSEKPNEQLAANAQVPSVELNFQAQNVYAVLGKKAGTPPLKIKVFLDDQPLPKKYWTNDMDGQGNIVVNDQREYSILDLGNDYGRHTLRLEFESGIQMYTFTFGA